MIDGWAAFLPFPSLQIWVKSSEQVTQLSEHQHPREVQVPPKKSALGQDQAPDCEGQVDRQTACSENAASEHIKCRTGELRKGRKESRGGEQIKKQPERWLRELRSKGGNRARQK